MNMNHLAEHDRCDMVNDTLCSAIMEDEICTGFVGVTLMYVDFKV